MNGTDKVMYFLGALTGILVGFALFSLFVFVINKLGGKVQMRKWKKKENDFDERQKLARAMGMKYAYQTLLFYVLAVSILDEVFSIRLFMSLGGMWLGICISIFVFSVYAITRDAYMSLYENAKGVLLLFLAISVINFLCSAPQFAQSSPLLENGAISTAWLNVFVGVLFALIMVVFAVRVAYNNNHSEEEE